jgi:aspartate-semialdehyde dehydrogenase
MLQVLQERGFPVDDLVLLASERSRGTKVTWRGRDWTVQVAEPGVFKGCDIALFSAGAARSRDWGLRAADEGAIVIDNSSAWRMHPDVPLVVPEVNGERARNPKRGIIANPNCAAIQLVIALEALRRAGGLRRVVATTLQSVSGAGQKGIDALDAQLAGRVAEGSPFPGIIAGNVIPWIGPRNEQGWNEEEDKLRNETRKILELPDLAVVATCVRVPVRVGHSVAAMVETERPLSPQEVRNAFEDMPGLDLARNDRDPLPRDAAGTDNVRVGHVRSDPDFPEVLHLWVVADNLRKGAATNAVQIAEQLIRD